MADALPRTASGMWAAAGRDPAEFAKIRADMIADAERVLRQYRDQDKLQASDEIIDTIARVITTYHARLLADVTMEVKNPRRRR